MLERSMKTVLVLGAGASLANGLKFRSRRMRDTLPPLDTTFFETVAARKIALGPALRRYLRIVLSLDLSTSTLREQPMEQVFADVFYDFNEAQSDASMLNAYIDLVDLYVRVLQETTNWLCKDGRTGAPIGKLLAAAAKHAEELTVITFNHDLVIENEIHRRAALSSRWCVDQCYGSMSGDLQPLVPLSPLPVFHDHDSGRCDHSRPITLLKLHGSLNWVERINSRRPTASVLNGSRSLELNLLIKRQVLGREVFVRRKGRGRTQWNLWPIVVPPVYAKSALRGAMAKAWADARTAVEEADRLVVFGYSLPALDIEAEKLFERAIAQNSTLPFVDVINPAHESAARFSGVGRARPMHWCPSVDVMLARDEIG
jgi:hypothetical protein